MPWASTPPRWFDAVTLALQTPIETPDYPGHRFALQCADVAGAVAALARSNGRMLAVLAWRGTEVQRVIARWRPEQFVEISARDVARANPWAGIPGCIYLGGSAQHADGEAATYFVGGVRGLDDRLCKRVDMRGIDDDNGHAPLALRLAGEPTPDMPVDDERWKVPPSLGMMLQPLEALHRPGGSLYRAYTAAAADAAGSPTSYRYGPNRIDLGGTPVDVGFSIDLTIDPDTAGARAAHGRVLHGSRRCLSRAGHEAQGRRRQGRRPADCSSTRRCAWPRWP